MENKKDIKIEFIEVEKGLWIDTANVIKRIEQFTPKLQPSRIKYNIFQKIWGWLHGK